MAGKVQQYRRTEYIQLPPGTPTLDAKNSPLALLAQTCSAIGKEPASVRKSSMPSKLYSPKEVKKSDVSVKSSVQSSGSNVATRTTSPVLSEAKRMSPFRTLKRETSPSNDCSSPSKKRRCSPDAVKMRDNLRSHSESLSPLSHRKMSVSDVKRRSTASLDETDSKAKLDAPSRHKSLSGASPTSRSLGGPCGCPTSSSADTSRSASQRTSPQQQLLSAYDPYCMGCQGSHLPGNSCLDAMKMSNFSSLYPFANPSAYPIYAQMLMAARNANAAAAAVDPAPHVCNWVNADTGNCGKRFASGEELFNHLRTHAISTSTSSSNSNFLLNGLDKMAANPYASYLSQHAAALAAVAPASANPLSTNFLSRSHSPLSRFQSYKATNMLSQLSGLPSLPIAAGMGPYCSPYSVYGQRLGAAASGFSYP